MSLAAPTSRVIDGAVFRIGIAAAQWLVGHDGSVWAFFLFPPRAWEFLAGGVLALSATAGPRGPLAANLASAVGLAIQLRASAQPNAAGSPTPNAAGSATSAAFLNSERRTIPSFLSCG